MIDRYFRKYPLLTSFFILLAALAVPALIMILFYIAKNLEYNAVKDEVDALNRKISIVTPAYNEMPNEVEELGLEGVTTIPELVEKLYDQDPDMQNLALTKALEYINASESGNLSFQAKGIPILIERLCGDDVKIRETSAWALSNLYKGPPPYVYAPVLYLALDDESDIVIRDLITTIGNIGPDAFRFLPKLKDILETSTNEEIKTAAQDAILKIEAKE